MGSEEASTLCTRGIYIKDTVKGYVPDYDVTFPYWGATAEHWLKYYSSREFLLGAFVWTGFDYRGEPTPYEWPCINSHFGIMDVCGFPKNNYYYYQSWWSNSLGSKKMPLNSHLEWKVPYRPGVLEARGIRDGRKLTSKLETTSPPAAIVLIPDRVKIKADGEDVSVINVCVYDDKGREVADAGNLINFELKGSGKIIGVGNGDPSSHEADKCPEGKYMRRLFNGKCQVIIKTGDYPGQIMLKAYSKDLQPETLKIGLLPGSPRLSVPDCN